MYSLIVSAKMNDIDPQAWLAHVLACIAQHPDVREAGIIGVPDETWGQRVKAIVVADPDSGLTEAAIIEHCRTRMASYKKPAHVVIRSGPVYKSRPRHGE